MKYAVTIHDLTAWMAPETLPPIYTIYNRLAIRHAVQQAALVVTVSHAVEGELTRLLGPSAVDTDIRVIHNAKSGDFRRLTTREREGRKRQLKTLGIDGKYILSVGTLEKRKNIIGLLEAFLLLRQSKKATSEMKLVLAGRRGYKFSEIADFIHQHRLADSVIVTDYVREDELLTLYNFAELFAFPSLYEGFGIPLLEAMACGVPVIANAIPSSQEVAGDSAVFVRANDEKAFADRMLEILLDENLRDELVQRGLERVEEFSWEKSGRMHAEAYRAALEA